MRVAFIGTRGVPATYSGFETAVENIGRRMVDLGHEVEVYCRSGHYAARPEGYLGMRLTHLPALRQKHLETLSHTLLSSASLPRDSAVICMGVGNAPIVRLLEARGRPTVFNVDGADWQRKKWGRFASWYLERCEKMAAASTSTLVSDAESVRRYYQNRYRRGTELVAYGADPPLDTGTETLATFGLESGRYALFVGRLVPENAPDQFLAAVRAARLGIPSVVVGDSPYADEYIRGLKVDPPPGTVFTGYQFGAAYQQLSHHAGVFVLAASVGGTHPVLVEQMAAGNCVLARDTESNREVLGDAGLLWNTTGELAEQLRLVFDTTDLRGALGKAARLRAQDRYDWDAVTTRYLDLCEGTLARSGRRSKRIDRTR